MSKSEAVLATLIKRFRPTEAADVTAVYQLHLTGDGGGHWHLTIAEQQCTLTNGSHPEPDVTITMTADDWVDLLSGRLDGYVAFLEGRVEVKGDLSLALRLQGMFGF